MSTLFPRLRRKAPSAPDSPETALAAPIGAEARASGQEGGNPTGKRRITRLAEYPLIAAEKLSTALDRLDSVHARFGGELRAMDEELTRQAALSQTAAASCERMGPALDSIGGNLRTISDITRQSGALVSEGFSGLKEAVAEVQELIATLRARTDEMRGIETIGRQVSEGVNMVAETAVENKLIAINAAITASKASDKVKGFKVIASEISRLSALMSDRVKAVVSQAAQVGNRMQTIVRNMDEGILSTQKALGNIEEAFALLESVAASIGDAQSMNEQMLGGNARLEEENGAISSIIADIERSISDTAERTHELKSDMDAQGATMAAMKEALPAYLDLCREIADTEDRSVAEEPKIFRMKESSIFDVDPTHSRMLREVHFSFTMYVRLLRFSSDQKIVPYLADTWLLLQDGRTWEFSLKRGATFQDGSPITSRDVKFSLERLMNPELGSPYANLYNIIEGAEEHIGGKTRGVSGIAIPDPYTVRITLKSSFNFFLSLMALGYSSVIKENPSYYSRKLTREDIMSAGAFRLEPAFAGDRDVLSAFPGFLNGRPFLDGMEVLRDPPNVKEAFLKGELDGAYNMKASFGKELQAAGFNGNLKNYTSRFCYGLVVNYKRDTWLSRHRELFRALSMAFDKDRLIQETLGGFGERADSVIPHSILGTPSEPFVPHDLEAAKATFEAWRGKADFSRPLKLALRAYPALPDVPLIEKAIRNTFAALGLAVETEIVELSKPLDWFVDKFDVVFAGFMGEVDLYSGAEPFISRNGGDNWFGYFNQDVYDLLMSSISIKDNLERSKVFVEIMKALTNDGFMVPLFYQKVLSISGSNVNGLFLGPEETYIADAIYLWPKGAAPGVNASLIPRYRSDFDQLDKRARDITARSRSLVLAGRAVGASLAGQQAEATRAYELFNRFLESASGASKTRGDMVARIRTTAAESAKTGQATRMIQGGLEELVAAVDGTRKALGQVRHDIELMQATTEDISSSNEFIGSIAINAAIIAAKSERGTGDLRKVSESIAEQARRNDEYTGRVVASLAQMGESARAHDEALAQIAASLSAAARRVGDGGAVLDRVGPLLSQADERSRATEDLAAALAGAIEEARKAVDQIQTESAALALQTDTLKFGLDLEQGVADILGDVTAINKEIRDRLISATSAAQARP